MALQGHGTDITLLAAADFAAQQYRAVVVDSTGKAAIAGVGARAVGVLQDNVPSGEAASVRVMGVTKMVAGAAVAAGGIVSTDSTGRAVVSATTGHAQVGIALTAAAAAGEVISVLLGSGAVGNAV